MHTAPQQSALVAAVPRSHPLLTLPSQLANPGLHADTAHASLTHAAVPFTKEVMQFVAQVGPHAVAVCDVSHPFAVLASPLQKPTAHPVELQTPLEVHDIPVACTAAVMQLTQPTPQWFVVQYSQPFDRLPSQSDAPEMHPE